MAIVSIRTGGATLCLVLANVIPCLAQTPPRAVTRDSAGIRIVEHPVAAALPIALRIDSVPLLDLGGLRDRAEEELDARTPFYEVRRLRDGRWVVVDFSALKLFDATGRYLATLGRAGDGPGEFRQVRSACVFGDTIVAMEYGRPRISVFHATGRHIRTATLDGEALAHSCFGDGTFAVGSTPIPDPASTMPPARARFLDLIHTAERLRWDGSSRGEIGTYRHSSFNLYFQEIFSFVVAAGRIHTGIGDVPEFRVADANGRLLRIVRWQSSQTRITPAVVDSAVRRTIPQNTSPAGIAERIERAGAMPHRDFTPAYSVLAVDPRGRIWVQDPFPARPRGWTIFDDSGQMLGRAFLPSLGRYPAEIAGWDGDNVVLGWSDDDGAPRLSVHRVR